jgi:hypothetical protein
LPRRNASAASSLITFIDDGGYYPEDLELPGILCGRPLMVSPALGQLTVTGGQAGGSDEAVRWYATERTASTAIRQRLSTASITTTLVPALGIPIRHRVEPAIPPETIGSVRRPKTADTFAIHNAKCGRRTQRRASIVNRPVASIAADVGSHIFTGILAAGQSRSRIDKALFPQTYGGCNSNSHGHSDCRCSTG